LLLPSFPQVVSGNPFF